MRVAEMHDLFEEDLLPRFPHLRVRLLPVLLQARLTSSPHLVSHIGIVQIL